MESSNPSLPSPPVLSRVHRLGRPIFFPPILAPQLFNPSLDKYVRSLSIFVFVHQATFSYAKGGSRRGGVLCYFQISKFIRFTGITVLLCPCAPGAPISTTGAGRSKCGRNGQDDDTKMRPEMNTAKLCHDGRVYKRLIIFSFSSDGHHNGAYFTMKTSFLVCCN